MLLAIEQGNTNTLFAVHDGDELDRPVARGHRLQPHRRRIRRLAVASCWPWPGCSSAALDGCIISSVVPQSIFNLRNLARRYLHVEPLVIGENADLGIEVRIDKPSEAGADRLVNAIGAHIVYPGDLIVIDSGTATTFDVDRRRRRRSRAASSRRASTCPWRPCTRPPPSCRASPSSGPQHA